jgi:AraC-like DNA-binding protein
MLPLLKQESTSKTTNKIDYAERACVFIKKNYPHPLKMQEIANNLYISEKHLYRLFRNRFGVSPQTFLIETRMQIAFELLKNSNFSVTEIANSVGYISLPSFIKIFTKYYGASPSAIRHN